MSLSMSMARKLTITFNSKAGRRGYIYCLLLLLLFACKGTTQSSSLKLISEAKIEERGNNILHGLPLSMQLLEDSLVGIRLDASRYNIYNYYTGKIVASPLPDSTILPELLRQARAYSSLDYQLMSLSEGREIGEPVLSAEGVFYSKEERQYYLLFTATFIADTFIIVKAEGCPPCNYIIANIMDDTAYANRFGDNSFLVFPSISTVQLADYDRMLKEYGQVNIGYINNKKLYKLLQKKDKDRLGGKPKWVGLNRRTKECFCFSLKEMYLADSIYTFFK